jgi:small subunit ribosomal protein S2
VLDFIIPGNDDAIRSIQLVTATLADVIIEVRGGGDEPVERPAGAPVEPVRATRPLPTTASEQAIQAAVDDAQHVAPAAPARVAVQAQAEPAAAVEVAEAEAEAAAEDAAEDVAEEAPARGEP